jgi:hypothetical protein
MIPKASQRGSADDLAAHLMNTVDNEDIEVMVLEGGIANDFFGWAREQEASFLTLTKGVNSFYQCAYSPNPLQPITDEQAQDFKDRILDGLGLGGQPHALVKHIKQMASGHLHTHYHLVASRLDINECKAIPISFDHIKLQYITRDFARDHDLELPPGYYNYDDRAKQTYRQKTLYEKKQSDRGLPTREEHHAIVTPLWEGRVSPEGFIKALEHSGYMLAVGRRPVVIDVFGEQHSLARLIDIDAVKVADIRDYLGDHYNLDNLPSVEEAKEKVAEHIKLAKAFERKDDHAEKIEALKHGQSKRRAALEQEIRHILEGDKAERARFEAQTLEERMSHRKAFLDQRREIHTKREAAKPEGLAAFLGRVTGASLIQSKIHKHQDKLRLEEHQAAKQEITDRQHNAREEMRLSHQMRAMDSERKKRDLAYREAQELHSLKTHLEKQARLLARGIDPAPTPALQLELTPMGRRAVPSRVKTRYTGLSHQNRATKEEFHAKAATQDGQKLEPRKEENPKAHPSTFNRAQANPSGNLAQRKKRGSQNSETGKQANDKPQRENLSPSFKEVPTREVPAETGNMRELRKRGITVPKAGALTTSFEDAANFNEGARERFSGDGDTKSPAPDFLKSAQSVSQPEKPFPPKPVQQELPLPRKPDAPPHGREMHGDDDALPWDDLEHERDREF